MLLTRAPLYSWYCYHFLVRLACVRHAASVDSEPGSNSRLKPDIDPPRRRSKWTRSCPCFSAAGTLPCETDQAKPDRMSHDWHVQPDCQRSLRKLGLGRFLFGSRLRPEGLIGPRTWCASPASSRSTASTGVFARTFRKYRTFDLVSSQPRLPNRHPLPAHRAAQNSQTSNRQKARARSARTRGISSPGSCNGLFSLGIPYRGSGYVLQPRLAQRTGLPFPSTGQDPMSTGKLHCSSFSFSRVAQATPHCNSRRRPHCCVCNLPRIPTD